MAFTRAFGQRRRGELGQNLCNSLPWELKIHLRNTTAQKLNFLRHSGESGQAISPRKPPPHDAQHMPKIINLLGWQMGWVGETMAA